MALVKQEFDDEKKPGTKPTSTHTGSTRIPVSTNTDDTNLSGTDSIQSARGTPKVVQPSSSTGLNTDASNLAGTDNIRNAGGSPSTPQKSSTINESSYIRNKDNDMNLSGIDRIQSSVGTPSKNDASRTKETSNTQINNITPVEAQKPLNRSNFDNDNDYERYLVENRVNLTNTNSDAFKYIREKADESGITARDYYMSMIKGYRDKFTTENFQQKYINGELSPEQANYINEYVAVIDANNSRIDPELYANDTNLYQRAMEQINSDVEKLNKRYSEGKIDYLTYQNEYSNLQKRWDENEQLGERLRSYQVLQGFDYYDWARENNQDVSDFEKRMGALDDNAIERIGNLYGASLIDSANILPQTYELLKTIGYRNVEDGFNFTDEDTLSSRLTNQADELRRYAMAGTDGFENWSLQTLSSLMPMINSMLAGNVLGTIAGLSGQTLNTAVSAFTNVTLGAQTAGQVARQRIEEGNDILTASLNGMIHGTITGLVEGLDAGRVASLFTGEAGKFLLSNALLSKANMIDIAKFLNATAMSEGAEEIIEYFADQIADRAQNLFAQSIEGKVNIETASPQELANQFVMAYAGAIVMGLPTAVNVTIDSKRKYNGAIESRKYFESVLNKKLSSPEEIAMAEKAIEAINHDIAKYTKASVLDDAVDLPSDRVDSAGTYEEVMNNLANAVRQDIQGKLKTAQETLNRAQQLESNFQNALLDKGINMTAQDYLNLNNVAKENFKNISNFLNDNGIDNAFTRLMDGQNGLITKDGGIVLNTDQTKTIDIDSLADLIDKDFKKAIKNKTNKIFDDAGAQESITTSASHEITHYAEKSGQWNKLRDLVKESMGAERFDKASKRLEELYKSRGITDVNPEAETVAFFIQKNLGNTDFLERLSTYNNNLFSRLYENVRALFSGDTQVQLENVFERAFRDAQKKDLIAEGSMQFSAGGTTGLLALMYSDDPQLKARGELLDKKLNQAIEMSQSKNYTPEEIWNKTGWIKKADGHWRFQFYDGADIAIENLSNILQDANGKNMRYIFDNKEGGYKLKDIVGEDNVLFKMYPELNDVLVGFYADSDNTLGSFTQGEDLGDGYKTLPQIHFNLKNYYVEDDNNSYHLEFTPEDIMEISNTFFHELQHAIQNIEGFEGGSNLDYASREVAREKRKSIDKRRDEIENELRETGINNPTSTLDDISFALRFGGEYLKNLEAKYTPKQIKLFEQLKDIKSEYTSTPILLSEALEIYENNQGEIEAREEAERSLSEYLRKETPKYDGRLIPDYLGGVGESALIKTDVKGRKYVYVDENILDNVPIENWENTVKNILKNKFSQGVNLKNDIVNIDKNTRKETTFSNYSKWLKANAPSFYEDKLRSLNNADEILETSYGWINEGLNHPRKDKIVSFARGKVLMQIGKHGYTADVITAINKNGKLSLYDIIDLTPEIIKEKKVLTPTADNRLLGNDRSDVTAFDNQSISNNNTNVKNSLGQTNNSLTNLENFLRSDEIADKLGLLDGYTGFNSNVGNLEYDSQRPAQTREEVLQNNIEGMIDTIDNAFQEYLQNNDITPEQVDVNDLRDYLSDPYLAEGSDLEALRTTGELDELASLATEYLTDKYGINKESNTRDSDGRVLSKQQQNYFKDSKIRDENGNLLVVYHGTPNGTFNEFNKYSYFTANPEYAERYTNGRTWNGNEDAKVYQGYLNMTKPFDIYSDTDAMDIFINEYVKGGYANGIDPGNQQYINHILNDNYGIDWTEADDLIDFLKENGYDYDGLVLNEGADGGYGEPVFERGNSYVIFSPEQFKNIDNTNPTNNPDIRFSLGKQDTQESVQDDSDRSKYFDYGMNPVRNVDILKRTEAGPTSRFWNNLANSQYVSDEEAERIQKMVRDGLGSYEKTSRKIQDREAKNMLRQMGMENTFKYVMNADSIETMSVDNALARALLSEMNQKGLAGTENYYQLEARLQWRATMQGQALEAWKGFRDSTPEGQVVTIRSEIERIQQGLSERYGDGAYDIQLNEELIDDYLRARTQEERDLIREQLARDVAKQIPPSAIEQLNSFRHLSMLFNPRTWVKNSLANKAMGYVNEGTRVVRSVLESIAYERGKNNENSVFNGMERQAGAYNPLNKSDVEQFKQFKEQYNTEFKNKIDMKYSAIDAGNILLGTGFGEEVSRYRDAFTSKFLNKLSEINAKMMSDAPGMSTAYAKSMVGYLKANNLDYKTMTPEQIKKAQEFAINEAKYATFNSYNKLASDIAQFSRDGSVARRVVIESFLPFKRTPLNLLKTGFRYTPVGLAETMTNGFVQLKQGKLTANEWINNVAQGMTGSAIMALGALLSQMGIFRTKDDDKARKQYFDQELGEQEYSLNWDGKSYTIDWLDPMIVPLAMGAELMKYVQNGEYSLDELTNLIAGLADPMFETSMLSGIQKNLSNYSQGTTQWWGRIAQNAVTNYVQQYIPSIFGATARTIDDTRRSTYTDKGAFDRAYRQTLNKIPGLSMLNEPYVNRKGEEQKNQGNNIIDRAILNFLSPGYYANKEITKYDKEMYRLYEQTGNIDSLPSSDSKSLTFEGETYKFTPKQYTQWQKTRWSTETEYVNQFMDSKVYQNLTDEERVETIKDIRSYAQKVAKQHFLADQGIEYDDKQLSDARGAIVNGIELYAYYDYLNNAGSTQSKKIEYLEKTDLSQKQKEYLWGLNDYKKSYQDAYNKVFGKESAPKETTPTPAPEEEREEFYA